MQNLGRFGETRLNKVIFCRLFGMFLSVSTGGYGTELATAEKHIVPCQVCLEIDRDGAVFGPLRLVSPKKNTVGFSITLNLTG